MYLSPDSEDTRLVPLGTAPKLQLLSQVLHQLCRHLLGAAQPPERVTAVAVAGREAADAATVTNVRGTDTGTPVTVHVAVGPPVAVKPAVGSPVIGCLPPEAEPAGTVPTYSAPPSSRLPPVVEEHHCRPPAPDTPSILFSTLPGPMPSPSTRSDPLNLTPTLLALTDIT